MTSVLLSLLAMLRGFVRSRAALHLEILALRHQLHVLHRSRPRRLHLAKADRWLWAWLSCAWSSWRTALVIVKPETVIAWHRQGFGLFWAWKSRRRVGRPPLPADVRTLIRTMAQDNPLWGAPRIHGELIKLGVRCVSGDRRQVHRPPRHQASIANLANVPCQSSPASSGGRLLRHAHGHLPALVRPRHPGARAASYRACRGH